MNKKLVIITPIIMIIIATLIAIFVYYPQQYSVPSWNNGELDPPNHISIMYSPGGIDIGWVDDDMAEYTVLIMEDCDDIKPPIIAFNGATVDYRLTLCQLPTNTMKGHILIADIRIFMNTRWNYIFYSVDKDGNKSKEYKCQIQN